MGRKRKGDPVSGWVCLDKPYDLTSTHAVSRVRRLFNAQKAGHAGTLDPLATGILPIALGEATKTVPYLMDADKTYRFTIAWGRTTATFDRAGETTQSSDVRPDPDAVAAALPAFVGEISQVPPIYSAIKVDGERAYDLARAGETVELKARIVRIDAARVTAAPDADHVEIEIDCGKGVYVRAVVRDLAERLGACGHVSALRRTRVGGFTEARAIGLETLEEFGHKARHLEALLPVETALDDIPALAVTDEDAFRLKQGRSIVLIPRQVEALKTRLNPGSRTVSATTGGQIIALCEMRAGRLEPARVFNIEKSGDLTDVDYDRTQG
ncbi:MAG: tRNA pseudouridine(55) synthase TruB [Phenylobacterium sp.]|uniref:tRNA pseudouridine(55) synthase TruB n=1 Tax=Phenylobacterium sp. TaxID=1871053 RepID=UPI0027368D92|nr:tRNA pseudouridine(55) synthase TruB [Phenylobacterium sp.]MDP3172963.1 tRNA pseudouridine(55) synthase TruB [Phenylobacterium sp.]